MPFTHNVATDFPDEPANKYLVSESITNRGDNRGRDDFQNNVRAAVAMPDAAVNHARRFVRKKGISPDLVGYWRIPLAPWNGYFLFDPEFVPGTPPTSTAKVIEEGLAAMEKEMKMSGYEVPTKRPYHAVLQTTDDVLPDDPVNTVPRQMVFLLVAETAPFFQQYKEHLTRHIIAAAITESERKKDLETADLLANVTKNVAEMNRKALKELNDANRVYNDKRDEEHREENRKRDRVLIRVAMDTVIGLLGPLLMKLADGYYIPILVRAFLQLIRDYVALSVLIALHIPFPDMKLCEVFDFLMKQPFLENGKPVRESLRRGKYYALMKTRLRDILTAFYGSQYTQTEIREFSNLPFGKEGNIAAHPAVKVAEQSDLAELPELAGTISFGSFVLESLKKAIDVDAILAEMQAAMRDSESILTTALGADLDTLSDPDRPAPRDCFGETISPLVAKGIRACWPLALRQHYHRTPQEFPCDSFPPMKGGDDKVSVVSKDKWFRHMYIDSLLQIQPAFTTLVLETKTPLLFPSGSPDDSDLNISLGMRTGHGSPAMSSDAEIGQDFPYSFDYQETSEVTSPLQPLRPETQAPFNPGVPPPTETPSSSESPKISIGRTRI